MKDFNAIQKMFIAIRNKDVMVIDDHDNSKFYPVNLLLYKSNNKLFLCPAYDNGFCLNPLYIDEHNNVHLDTGSVGGTLNFRGCHNNADKLKEVIKFNQSRIDNGYEDQLMLVL